MALWVKICGLTSGEDARLAVEAGADAVGINLIPTSKRHVDVPTARAIVEAVGGRAQVVAVVADLSAEALVALRLETGIDWLQLHGHEAPATLRPLLPHAYKAVAIGSPADVEHAATYPGERLLTDTKVEGALGGTGKRFDWRLVEELSRRRELILAGGLDPDNVADAVAQVHPFGVDVASGVEGANPRRKDPEKMARFVARARGAEGER